MYQPSPEWAGLMLKFGWNEAPLLMQIVPAVIPALVAGIGQALAAIAATPGLGAAFPGTADANAALEQWASCAPLAGAPLLSLGSAELAAAFPAPPELCGWAVANLGLSLPAASVPLPAASAFMTGLAQNPGWAAEVVAADPSDLGFALGCSPEQAQLFQGYTQYIAVAYGKGVLAGMAGPPLAPGGSGPIYSRTVEQLFFGFPDPLLSGLTPVNASAPAWAFSPLGNGAALRAELLPYWTDLAAALANGSAPDGFTADRFFSYEVEQGYNSLPVIGNLLRDQGEAAVRYPGGSLAVSGRLTGPWGWGDMSNMPFTADNLDTLDYYWTKGGLLADPALGAGIGRVTQFEWDGQPAAWRHAMRLRTYVLTPASFVPCGGFDAAAGWGGAGSGRCNGSAAVAAAAAERACVTGDTVAGLYNLTASSGAPLFIALPGFAGADPRVLASIGPGAAAQLASSSGPPIWFSIETSAAITVEGGGGLLVAVGTRPSAITFPNLWAGDGPDGLAILPAYEFGLSVLLPSATLAGLALAEYTCLVVGRQRAGEYACIGSILAGLGAYLLWARGAAERGARARAAASAKAAADADAAEAGGSGGASPRGAGKDATDPDGVQPHPPDEHLRRRAPSHVQ